MAQKKYKVVIIGHGYTSRLAVIRSVAQIDCEITVIVMTGYKKDGKTLNKTLPIDCHSKFVDHVLFCKNDAEELVTLLLNECVDKNRKNVIFPDSDFAASAIDSNLNRLKDFFLFPHIGNKQGAVVDWMNKEKQKELARTVGLNVVNSISIKMEGQDIQIPTSIHYPCFTKTRSYTIGTKHTLKRCDNEKELRDFISSLSCWFNHTLLVEDFKEIEHEYAALGFSDGKEVVIPGIVYILSMAHGNHYGVACKGEVAPVTGFEELISKFKDFVLKIGFVGVFDIDFFQSHGEFFFSELNLRIGGSCYAITKAGVNLPGMFVKYLNGDSIGGMKKEITSRATYVDERMLTDDWIHNYITTKSFYDTINSATISFIKDEEDPRPYRSFVRFVKTKRIKRFIKKTLLKT